MTNPFEGSAARKLPVERPDETPNSGDRLAGQEQSFGLVEKWLRAKAVGDEKTNAIFTSAVEGIYKIMLHTGDIAPLAKPGKLVDAVRGKVVPSLTAETDATEAYGMIHDAIAEQAGKM